MLILVLRVRAERSRRDCARHACVAPIHYIIKSVLYYKNNQINTYIVAPPDAAGRWGRRVRTTEERGGCVAQANEEVDASDGVGE